MRCDEQDVSAPHVGCGCRACCIARERSLDPRLSELVSYDCTFTAPSPARSIVHRYIDLYLVGRIEWAALHVEIIKALIEQNDKSHKMAMDAISLRPPFYAVTKDNEWMLK